MLQLHNSKVYMSTHVHVQTNDTPSIILGSVLVPLLMLVGFFAIFWWYGYKKTKDKLRNLTQDQVKDFKNGNSIFDPHDPPIHSHPIDPSLEIPDHLIELDKKTILGSHQFPIIFEGTLTTLERKQVVAVKTVTAHADVETFKSLLSEIKIMGFLKKHPNIQISSSSSAPVPPTSINWTLSCPHRYPFHACKWMSPEAIKDVNSSIKSDVWSFSVFLYEICSLGEIPYPGVPVSHKFIDRLCQGYRMASPQYSDKQMYEILEIIEPLG